MAMDTQKERKVGQVLSLFEIPFLDEEGYNSSLSSNTVLTSIDSYIHEKVPCMRIVRETQFLLQKNFREQAKHEEIKCQQRLDKDKIQKEDAAIRICIRKRKDDTKKVKDHPLLQLFLKLLANEDPCIRSLSVRSLEKTLAVRCTQELGQQLEHIHKLYSYLYFDPSVSSAQDHMNNSDRQKEKLRDESRKNLNESRTILNESVLNIEHLWRELGHLYIDMDPQHRSSIIKNIPHLAAQHLLDGFCIELLDGDSNMIHLEWIKKVFYELGVLIGRESQKRIFVLSVMGVQSSGKSTLLNTMFGIQMRTSVGQCTRGVNMQLLAVEGRREYDYILLLDSEGCRATEYHGLPGSEKRDNQMATLSILLADATIVVISGEDDAAIKEILPIVLMAYQGSQLAESKGVQLSSLLFFVYNRIDTTQKNKFGSIIQTLANSLDDAFEKVKSLIGDETVQINSEHPFQFRSFKINVSNPSECDVCILGNVKKEFEPPGDVPDMAYGEALVQFREHVHRRVTSPTGKQIWKSRSIEEFSKYIEEVWNCIRCANFVLRFPNVMDRIAFDKLDSEYKAIEQRLAESYRKIYDSIIKNMIIMKGNHTGTNASIGTSDESWLQSIEIELRNSILPIEKNLDEAVNVAVNNEEGRDNWRQQFQLIWKEYKTDQSRNWLCNLKTSYTTLFMYEHHVEEYKKKMRTNISKLFNSPTTNWTDTEKSENFEKLYNKILMEAQQQFPPKDVEADIGKVYQSSYVISSRHIDINSEQTVRNLQHYKNNNPDVMPVKKNLSFRERLSSSKHFPKAKEQTTLTQTILDCLESVSASVNTIVVGKVCYDSSIVSQVICVTDSNIKSRGVSENSEVGMLHIYGKILITDLMKEIQKTWEASNSVYAKLQQKSNKDSMYEHFLMVSNGVKKTQLFANHMANVLKTVLLDAFEKELVQRTSNAIRNERWLYDAKIMHKHIDLFLADMLMEKKRDIKEILQFVLQPRFLYGDVLQRLVTQKVPDVRQVWNNTFKKCLMDAIEKAIHASVHVRSGRAQKFVDDLREQCTRSFQSESLANALLINCTGEYEDCDNEEQNAFQESCRIAMLKVLEINPELVENQDLYAKKLSTKVLEHMKFLNDPVALPRCSECCPLCKSLCIEPLNHDTKLKPHEANHQPAGLTGFTFHATFYGAYELDPTTCSQAYEKNEKFLLAKKWYKYKDFSKVFPGWKAPQTNVTMPLREYIFAKHNKEIADRYNVRPCKSIPSAYDQHDLSTIREQLRRDIE